MKKSILLLSAFAILLTLSGCFGAKQASVAGRGGEVVGVSGRSFVEPAPYGMVKINRGFLKMGMETQDSLWGMKTPRKDVSVDGFWMDDTEITNSEYKQFVAYVRDSILRTRLADPAYGGDETYMITEDKNGDPVTPQRKRCLRNLMRMSRELLKVCMKPIRLQEKNSSTGASSTINTKSMIIRLRLSVSSA